jgi:NAD dependent epimerase/dehydratase family enzyme
VSGPVNATAPEPVTNKTLAKTIGRAMRRPALVPVPGFALKIAVGELADSLLTGQRVLPAVAQKNGYHFRYPDIDQAFRGMWE